MTRNFTIALALALALPIQADPVASCDRLDADMKGIELRLDGADLELDGETLVFRSGGDELIRIDAQRNLKVDGRSVPVPRDARADLDAYVVGFRKLSADAEALGVEGGRIAGKAITGLVDVLFTDATIEEYELRMEAQGAKIEARADGLCRIVASLQRTERALQSRIPAFPNVISPAHPAL